MIQHNNYETMNIKWLAHCTALRKNTVVLSVGKCRPGVTQSQRLKASYPQSLGTARAGFLPVSRTLWPWVMEPGAP